MNTLNNVTKKVMKDIQNIETSTIVTIGMALGADMIIKRLPVNTNAKAVMRVMTLTAVLVLNQKMAVGQAALVAALYVAIVTFLANMNDDRNLHGSGSVGSTGPTENTKWVSTGKTHAVTLRGHTYTHEDPVRSGPIEPSPLSADGPSGYLGHENATF
jgi:hypothetical protein